MLTKLVRELDEVTFQESIRRDDRPVLVDFWAPWCPPCRALAPTIEAIAEQFDGRANVAKLDIDQNPETAAAHGIRSIPTVAMFREKVMLFSQAGALPAAALENLLDQAKGLDMKKVHEEIATQQKEQQPAQ